MRGVGAAPAPLHVVCDPPTGRMCQVRGTPHRVGNGLGCVRVRTNIRSLCVVWCSVPPLVSPDTSLDLLASTRELSRD